MADFEIKANDRKPSITATLGFEGGGSPDLTDATVQFIMRAADPTVGTVKVKSSAVIVTPETGVVRYDWAAGDTDIPGEYHAEWEVTFADGLPQTFPLKTYHSITIIRDLDEEGSTP